MKIIVVGVCAVLIGVGAYLWQGETGDDAIFILPSDYKGVVMILYNHKKVQPVKYEKGRRVYEIPPDGVLKTQFPFNQGWHNLYRFYYKQNGRMIEIPYVIDPKDVRSDRVQVCCFSSGKAGKDPNDTSVEFAQFYIGSKEEIDNAIEKGEKINPAEIGK
ncbi:MAG TPA: hypothetical protein VEZ40_19170 [Pyrinomonadaceae bacterium]|nr:hypothetical protein [Pyrinomonadaceae bacterium]